ncbi:N-acetylmannosamine-6-phosphate 2-epimerase [Rubellimicrobium aerolatum]|uniref:Putative N-acetylmannosamine-6-phosphate 2-epimerase n=1 Tax=Rubellimicrobium aerolatum TaxID=490979 RepID=A0ABW0SF78_9RHOB|nr:N-acetylmannosamine-6-phosphate 2-epimerase [Rubellimicrobium aerolatum]MBP1806944.1 N-acylglucosamine-6-phosphate 2-epimerase [Rubellimicrobium aerolatum]
MTTLLDKLTGALVVSCQAEPGLPLDRPDHIAALAASAVLGGATAVRIQGAPNIRAVRAAVAVPVIGLVKVVRPGTDVYITPTFDDIDAVVEAGAHIVAFDATDRLRPVDVPALVARVRAWNRLSMADVSTVAEGRAAYAAGADVVGTTMAGYTPTTRNDGGPDFTLMIELARAGVPFVAEGRVRTPEEAARCLELGARFVVVGGAITRPDVITRRFADHIKVAAPRPAAREVHQ